MHTLTDTGRAALDGGHEIAAEVLQDLFAPLHEAQRGALMEALAVLTAQETVIATSPATPARESSTTTNGSMPIRVARTV
ncbi:MULTISPECIES: hypothetical protein [unclassified Curtobacterium]|uniref:hypothetical protein n=1 Tax=unclassified Curtobacterium TaxID=257496 RepID=UPI001042C382|nr:MULTISPECIES: hypothetical protein [unclassified Curtobacterium]